MGSHFCHMVQRHEPFSRHVEAFRFQLTSRASKFAWMAGNDPRKSKGMHVLTLNASLRDIKDSDGTSLVRQAGADNDLKAISSGH
jgi:hypothetical protein